MTIGEVTAMPSLASAGTRLRTARPGAVVEKTRLKGCSSDEPPRSRAPWLMVTA